MSRRVRVLLIGGSGQLGRELLRVLPADEVVAPTHAELDLRDAAAIARCVGHADVVVNAAADNRVDAAEADATSVEAINADAVGSLARAAAAAGAFFVHGSTDYVFDGRATTPYAEDAPAEPARGVRAVEAARRDALRVARPAPRDRPRGGLYAAGGSRGKGGSFVDKVIAQARAAGRSASSTTR
jgi:dTDP-4-dehydrorhamnose reductase